MGDPPLKVKRGAFPTPKKQIEDAPVFRPDDGPDGTPDRPEDGSPGPGAPSSGDTGTSPGREPDDISPKRH